MFIPILGNSKSSLSSEATTCSTMADRADDVFWGVGLLTKAGTTSVIKSVMISLVVSMRSFLNEHDLWGFHIHCTLVAEVTSVNSFCVFGLGFYVGLDRLCGSHKHFAWSSCFIFVCKPKCFEYSYRCIVRGQQNRACVLAWPTWELSCHGFCHAQRENRCDSWPVQI